MEATSTAAAEGAKQFLGGPVWALAQFLLLLAVGLALYMVVDSLRPGRRAASAGVVTEPLWIYTVLSAVFLVSLIVVQFIPGLQMTAAIPSLAAPIVTAAGFAYLLRVVFPKPTEEQLAASEREMERKNSGRTGGSGDSEEYTPFED